MRYPNDQPLPLSAQLLSDELKKLAREHPKRKLALLTHSMGGMVARQCVETAALNPGNIHRLIMVAPPNGGSRLADFTIGADLYEQLQSHRSSAELHERFVDRLDDGLNEARHDLKPDSAYLEKMAGLQRNPDVRYAVLLGTKAPATRRQLDDLRDTLQSASDENRVVKLLRPKLDAWLADLDELVDGEGDGIVAVKRGRLAGVEDTVLIPFNHLLTDPKSEGARQLQTAIGERLGAE